MFGAAPTDEGVAGARAASPIAVADAVIGCCCCCCEEGAMDVEAEADAEADAEAPPDAEAHADTNDAGVDAAEPLAANDGFAEDEDEEDGAEVVAAGAAAAEDDDDVEEEEEVEGALTTCFPAVVSMVMIASLTLLHIAAVGASMLSDLPGAVP